jgi:hypothetical protein
MPRDEWEHARRAIAAEFDKLRELEDRRHLTRRMHDAAFEGTHNGLGLELGPATIEPTTADEETDPRMTRETNKEPGQ